jgi:hypothetical protein
VHVRLNPRGAALVEASSLLSDRVRGKIIVKPFTSPPAPVSACGEPTWSLERPMFRNGLRFALSFLLVAFWLPLLGVSFLIAALCTAMAAILPRFRKQNDQDVIALQQLRVVDQFNFAEAMNAYEALIGADVRRQR